MIGWTAFLVIICILAATRPSTATPESKRYDTFEKTFEIRLAKAIIRLVGTRYKFGGTSLRGVDCSGAVYYLFKTAGKPIPRMSAWKMHSLYGKGYHYSRSRKYDLVWWTITPRRPYGHVGVMDGDHKHFWHSSSRKGFCQDAFKEGRYWDKFFADCGKIK